ncbi:MAG TPA: hypothetical protein GX505_11730 [Clostridiales bacterium]|nr:hypothetical protein [Clostridiales bacterium]
MIKVDFSRKAGKVKPLHGINNGPLSSECVTDTSKYYKEIGIPFVRLHDTDWPSFKMVDIPKIFPDFDADPEDPNNYMFEQTDQTIEAIVKTGAKVLYRLGTSIEHTKVKRFAVPPKDFVQWARICIGVIKHYNEGWANGYHFNIKHWEIWNEPENSNQMFAGGTAEDYYNLYITSTKMIKEYDSTLKLGGYAAGYIPDAGPDDHYFSNFLRRVKEENAPLDFFSWHIYTSDIKAIERRADYVKQELDKYGFGDIEIYLDEWNYFDADWVEFLSPEGEYIRKGVFEKIRSQLGAAFTTAAMIRMQTLPIDIAFYYDGQPRIDWCGLFDFYGCPIKTFYAMKAFGLLYKDENSVWSVSDTDGIYCLATENHVLIVNYGAKAGHYMVDMDNIKGGKVETYMVDEQNNLELTRTEYFEGYRLVQRVYLGENSIALLKISDI